MHRRELHVRVLLEADEHQPSVAQLRAARLGRKVVVVGAAPEALLGMLCRRHRAGHVRVPVNHGQPELIRRLQVRGGKFTAAGQGGAVGKRAPQRLLARGPVEQLPLVEVHGDAPHDQRRAAGEALRALDPDLLVVLLRAVWVDGAIYLAEQVARCLALRDRPVGIHEALLHPRGGGVVHAGAGHVPHRPRAHHRIIRADLQHQIRLAPLRVELVARKGGQVAQPRRFARRRRDVEDFLAETAGDGEVGGPLVHLRLEAAQRRFAGAQGASVRSPQPHQPRDTADVDSLAQIEPDQVERGLRRRLDSRLVGAVELHHRLFQGLRRVLRVAGQLACRRPTRGHGPRGHGGRRGGGGSGKENATR